MGPNFTESGWFYTVDGTPVGPFESYEKCDAARTLSIIEMTEANIPGVVTTPDFISEGELAIQAIA
jgi:hypothetical protein